MKQMRSNHQQYTKRNRWKDRKSSWVSVYDKCSPIDPPGHVITSTHVSTTVNLTHIPASACENTLLTDPWEPCNMNISAAENEGF